MPWVFINNSSLNPNDLKNRIQIFRAKMKDSPENKGSGLSKDPQTRNSRFKGEFAKDEPRDWREHCIEIQIKIMKLSGGKDEASRSDGQFSGNFVVGQLPLPLPPFIFVPDSPTENNGPRRRRPYGRVVEWPGQDQWAWMVKIHGHFDSRRRFCSLLDDGSLGDLFDLLDPSDGARGVMPGLF